jgi:hypothetical protein
MSLAAMVRFMIEEMSENFSAWLSLRSSVQGPVITHFIERGFIQGLNERNDSAVFFDSSSAQGRKIFKQCGVECVRVLARSGQSVHPDAVRDQQMIESAVEALEISADVLSIQRLS